MRVVRIEDVNGKIDVVKIEDVNGKIDTVDASLNARPSSLGHWLGRPGCWWGRVLRGVSVRVMYAGNEHVLPGS